MSDLTTRTEWLELIAHHRASGLAIAAVPIAALEDLLELVDLTAATLEEILPPNVPLPPRPKLKLVPEASGQALAAGSAQRSRERP